MLLAGHEVDEQSIIIGWATTRVRSHVIGANRVWIVANVDVESQVADLSGVLSACVAHLVGEPEVRGVGGVHGRGGAPGFTAGEGLTVGDGVFFVLGVCRCLRTAPGATFCFGVSPNGCRQQISNIILATGHFVNVDDGHCLPDADMIRACYELGRLFI